MQISVQEIKIQIAEERRRVVVELDGFSHTSAGKVASCVRIKPTWVQVETYRSIAEHPLLASHLLLLESSDRREILVIYPVSTYEVNNDLLVDNSDGTHIFANARRVVKGKDETVYVVVGRSAGSRPDLVRSVIERARELVGGSRRQDVPAKFWDGLGICTWESFGANRVGPVPDGYTKEKMLSVLPSFPIDIFLIDDGWQHHNKDAGGRKAYPPRARLVSFRANDLFDHEFEETIQTLKSKGVKKVGLWMALEGYWYGIDPHGELAEKYNVQPHAVTKPKQVRGGVKETLDLADPPAYLYLPSPDKAYQFWLDWFTELKGRGVDFVKVDNQACMEYIQSPTSKHALAAMWSGVVKAVDAVWGDMDRIIMCMSHNERMLNGPGGLDFGRPTGNLVFRNSDDYNMPYANPHGEFVLWNTRNSVLTSNLSIIPDYDMFASNPASHRPWYHALLRSMSTGSVLLSDTPDTNTDFNLLESLTGMTADGGVKLVRAPAPGIQLANRWFDLDLAGTESGTAHLAGAWDPVAQIGQIGAWNCREPGHGTVCTDAVYGADLEDLTQAARGSFIVYSRGYSANKSSHETYCSGDQFKLPFELNEGEFDAFLVSSLRAVGNAKVAILGMQDKLWPSGGLRLEVGANDTLSLTTTFASKRFAIYVEGGIVEVEGRGLVLDGSLESKIVEFEVEPDGTLELRESKKGNGTANGTTADITAGSERRTENGAPDMINGTANGNSHAV